MEQLNKWINRNHTRLYQTARNITKNHTDTDEFFQSCLLQVLERPDKINDIPDEQKLYYFIRVFQTNWNSNTSPYRYHQQKHDKFFMVLDEERAQNILDEIYIEDLPSLEWVYQQLNELNWFDRDLFMLWVELGTFTKVSQETTIPLNSVGKYIKETMNMLKTRWKNQ